MKYLLRLLLLASALAFNAFAAADYDFRSSDQPWMVVTILTSGVRNITLPDHDITIVHLSVQNDGTTASVATDKIFVMRNQDAAGAAVTMAENFTDGVKVPITPGGSVSFRAQDVPVGADNAREIQIKATGNGAKVLLIKGSFLGKN